MRVSLKLQLFAIVPALVIGAVFFSIHDVTSKQRDDGVVINLAGRQRMLSQKMTKETLTVDSLRRTGGDFSKAKEQAENTIKVFGVTLEALRHGKEAPLSANLKETQYRVLPAAQGDIAEKLDKITEIWKKFSVDLETILKGDGDIAEPLKRCQEDNLTLLREMDSVVGMMQKNSETRVNSLITIAGWGLGIGVVFALYSIFSALLVSRKIGRIVFLLSEFSDGNIHQREKVGKVRDEMDKIMSNVNNLGESLGTIIDAINTEVVQASNSSSTLAIASNSLMWNTDKINDQANNIASAAEQLSINIQNIAEASTTMANTVISFSSAMGQMKASLSQVAEQSQWEARIAEDANEQATKSKTIMERLLVSSRDINQILETITDIASQTNLLALNAAIEAASAGDAGKGFAVVADEVKNLSKLTARSTEEIAKKVKEMRANTAEAAEAISLIANVIEEVSFVSKAINNDITEQLTVADSVAHSGAMASQAANGLTDNIQHAAEASAEVAKNVLSTSSATKETIPVAHDVNSHSQGLAKMAGTLIGVVTKFKSEEKRFSASQVKVAHNYWKTRLCEAVFENRPLDASEITDHKTCKFGQWYFGEGSNMYGRIDAFREINAWHEKVHTTAKEISSLLKSGDKEKAVRLLNEFNGITDTMFNLLDKLEKQVNAA